MSDERETIEALRRSEEHFHSLLRSAEGFAVVRLAVDPDSPMGNRVVFASPSVRDVVGVDEDQLFEQWLQNVHPQDLPVLLEANARALQTGATFNVTARVHHPDKGWRWIQAIANVVRGQGGEPVFFNALMLDVTDQKRAEDAWRRNERELQNLFDTLEDFVFVLDSGMRVVRGNLAAQRRLGYDPADLPGMLVTDLHDPERGQEVARAFSDMWEERVSICLVPLVAKNGTRIPVETRGSRGRLGKQDVLFCVARDVTERQRIEEQLLASQRMESVGRLAGGIAHDFNNLLNAITGYGDIVLDELDSEDPVRADVSEMIGAARRAADLVKQLLAFSRQQVLEPRVLDLNHVVRNLERMLQRVIGEDIELVTRLAEPLGSVRADPAQLEQVIMNLAVNARDAMPGGGSLRIETSEVELDATFSDRHVPMTPGAYVLLTVSDNGQGMDEHVRARIFEPFFTTKSSGRGTGLGLSTVYGIVKQSGGTIWAYSAPGKGSTFKIYLPRVDAAPVEQSEPREIAARGTETVLVVEDEDVLRRLIGRMLGEWGYRVLEAACGADALALAGKHQGPIHLLLVDVIMPQMSGRELAGCLAESRSGIRVLYMSGYTGDAIVHHGILEDGLDFIQKPFSSEALAAKVRRVLDRDGT